MIQFQSKVCSSCKEPKPVTAFQPRRDQCRQCRNAYVLKWRRLRQPASRVTKQRRLDYGRISELLRDGMKYRDVATELGCSIGAICEVALRYGLRRRTQQIEPDVALQHAVKAYRAVRKHHDEKGGREPDPYGGPIACDFLDAAAPDSSNRHAPDYARWREMADRVIEMARASS